MPPVVVKIFIAPYVIFGFVLSAQTAASLVVTTRVACVVLAGSVLAGATNVILGPTPAAAGVGVGVVVVPQVCPVTELNWAPGAQGATVVAAGDPD